jgi:type IV secretory pathway TraG/TraD family ATPase VirD4
MTRSESTSDTGGGSDSRNEQIQTQRAVMPVELQKLVNLHGFFKLAGGYPICNVKLSYPKKREARSQKYAERDFIAKPMLDLIPATTPASPAGGSEGAGQGMQPQAHAEDANTSVADTHPTAETEQATLRVRKSPLEEGPAALEEILNELAEAFENDF